MLWRMPLGWGDAFREMENLRQEMNTLLEDFPGRLRATYPKINLWSNQEKLMLTAEVPGLTSEELEISVHGRNLILHGKPKAAAEASEYLRRERESREFYRTIELPCEVNAEQVEARLEKGILAVALPRAQSAKPRQITVTPA